MSVCVCVCVCVCDEGVVANLTFPFYNSLLQLYINCGHYTLYKVILYAIFIFLI